MAAATSEVRCYECLQTSSVPLLDDDGDTRCPLCDSDFAERVSHPQLREAFASLTNHVETTLLSLNFLDVPLASPPQVVLEVTATPPPPPQQALPAIPGLALQTSTEQRHFAMPGGNTLTMHVQHFTMPAGALNGGLQGIAQALGQPQLSLLGGHTFGGLDAGGQG